MSAVRRCDRCGGAAIAKMVAILPSGAELSLCGHHRREHYDALCRQGATILEGDHLEELVADTHHVLDRSGQV